MRDDKVEDDFQKPSRKSGGAKKKQNKERGERIPHNEPYKRERINPRDFGVEYDDFD